MTSTPTAPADRRAELAEAAYRLIAERGVEGMSMRALARTVGATTGLVSHHFIDRDDVVAAALDHATDVMVRRPARLESRTPFEFLAAVLPTDDEALENWRFSVAVRSAGLHDPQLLQFDRKVATIWHDNLPALLVDVVDVDPVVATDHLVAVIDGIALKVVLEPDEWPAERQLEQLRLGFAAVGVRVSSEV